jgi:hypothetical protein
VQFMETHKRKLGADHPDTLTSTNNLVYTYHAIGKTREAIDLIETCIQTRELKLGLDHPDTQSSISALDSGKGLLN